MKKFYIYPFVEKNVSKMTNSYIDDMVESLENYYELSNRGYNKKGIIDLFKYLNNTHIFILNWIEDLPDRRYSHIQIFLYFIIIILLKIKCKYIIYILHNKISHSENRIFIKKIIQFITIKCASCIITHSTDGIEYLRQRKVKTMKYFPHPIKKLNITDEKQKPIYDILIWGNVTPYKGIAEFLIYLKEKGILSKYKILIIGRFANDELYKEYKSIVEDKVEIINKYIKQATLKKIMSESKIVLFTYLEKSVLSSGVLIDTISYGKTVIGPNHGSFKDMKKDHIIDTYKNYNELIEMLDNCLNSDNVNKTKNNILYYYNKNNWQEFGKNINEIISKVY